MKINPFKKTEEHKEKIRQALLSRGIGKSKNKVCPHCKKSLNRKTHFGTRVVDGVQHTRPLCHECESRKARNWRLKKMKDPAFARRMYNANKAFCLKQRYGITLDELHKMEVAQKHRCAICGKKQDGRRLDVDHCHVTGKVRALLCVKCNMGIGYLLHDPMIMKKAIKYLDHHR